MSSKRGLGKGLSELLGAMDALRTETTCVSPLSEKKDTTPQAQELLWLPATSIEPGAHQARRTFSAASLEELADSIRTQGLLQPVIVRPHGQGRYSLLAGERRWRAAQLAGLDRLPAVVKDVDDVSAMALGLVENMQRDDLNPMDEARGLQRLSEEMGLTHLEIAEALGKSRAAISNSLRLLMLPEGVQSMLEEGQISEGHAKVLLGLSVQVQHQAAEAIVREGLSVRATEQWVARHVAMRHPERLGSGAKSKTDPDIQRLSSLLSEKLGAFVSIKHNTKGGGVLSVRYNTSDELEGLLVHLDVEASEVS